MNPKRSIASRVAGGSDKHVGYDGARADRYETREFLRSVVVSGLKKIDALSAHRVDQPMLFGDPARPSPREYVLEGLRFADTLERIAHNRLHQIENPKRHATIRLDPVT